MATQLEAPPRRRRLASVEVCPYCGQELLDHEAVRRVHESERKHERELEAAVKARATKLAEELRQRDDERHRKELERLQEQLATQQQTLAEERAHHKEALRDQKAKLRVDAEREATKRVEKDLSAKDRMIGKMKRQIDEQSRQLEHMTADERGELNEEKLLSGLKDAFPDDRIERRGRGRAGGDILHDVWTKSGDGLVSAGLIVYECKDTLQWSNRFIEQARKEGKTHKTPYLVIVTRAFPGGEKMLCVRDGVVVVHPTRLIELARVMRRLVVEVHETELRGEGQAAKNAALYEYLSSSDFREAFETLATSSDRFSQMLDKERRAHEQTWARRETAYEDLRRATTAIDTRIHSILEKRAHRKAGGGRSSLINEPTSISSGKEDPCVY
jgi:hypothetical protein